MSKSYKTTDQRDSGWGKRVKTKRDKRRADREYRETVRAFTTKETSHGA